MNVVFGVAERGYALEVAPHLDRLHRQQLERLKHHVGHRVVGRTAAEAFNRLPVVAAHEVLIVYRNLVYLAEAQIGHHLLREQVVAVEHSPVHDEQAVLSLDRGATQDKRILVGERHRRLEEGPEPLGERVEGVLLVKRSAGGDIDEVDVALVEQVGVSAKHLAGREILGYHVAALLDEVARRNNLEHGRMGLEHRVVILEHRAAKTDQGDANWWTLIVVFFFRHFRTISVMADRNWATSVN